MFPFHAFLMRVYRKKYLDIVQNTILIFISIDLVLILVINDKKFSTKAKKGEIESFHILYRHVTVVWNKNHVIAVDSYRPFFPEKERSNGICQLNWI